MKNKLYELIAGLAVVVGTTMLAVPALAADTTVTLTSGNVFVQDTVTVSEGDTVTFFWEGGFHDVIFADGVNSGAPVGVPGNTFARTFGTAGTFDYICSIHDSSGMIGTVTVEAAAATTTLAPGTPVAGGSGAIVFDHLGAGSSGPSTTPPPTTQPPTTTLPPTTYFNLPLTGTNIATLPMIGLFLVLGGIGIRLRLRRAS